MKNIFILFVAAVSVSALTACNNLFDDIYDRPQEIVPAKGQVIIDATSWTNWYYVNLNRLHQLALEGNEEALIKAQTEFEAYPIPMKATGDRVDTDSWRRKLHHNTRQKTRAIHVLVRCVWRGYKE